MTGASDSPPENTPRKRRKPVVEPLQNPAAVTGFDATPPPENDTLHPTRATLTRHDSAPLPSPQDAPDPEAADRAPARPAPGKTGVWLRLALGAAAALISAGATLWIVDLVAELQARSPWLGGAALALSLILALALAVMAGRELLALRRLRQVEDLRTGIAAARAAPDPKTAQAASDAALARLSDLYQHRPDLAWARARLKENAADAPDPESRLDLAERELLAPLDARAREEVAKAARQVAAVTALAPSALLDAAAALFFNLRMIRRLGEIYGGRGGVLSSIRLARQVVIHAMAAGLISLGDDLLEPLIGGGLASGLSRRAGEGVLNGALTARLGLAAMEVCRPAPFAAVAKPKLREVMVEAVRGRRKPDGTRLPDESADQIQFKASFKNRPGITAILQTLCL